jgi:hypothetical protein
MSNLTRLTGRFVALVCTIGLCAPSVIADLKSDTRSHYNNFKRELGKLTDAIENFRDEPDSRFEKSNASRARDEAEDFLIELMALADDMSELSSADKRYVEKAEQWLDAMKVMDNVIAQGIPKLSKQVQDFDNAIEQHYEKVKRVKSSLVQEMDNLLDQRRSTNVMSYQQVKAFNKTGAALLKKIIKFRQKIEGPFVQFEYNTTAKKFSGKVNGFKIPSLRSTGSELDELNRVLRSLRPALDNEAQETLSYWSAILMDEGDVAKDFDKAHEELLHAALPNIEQSKSKEHAKFLRSSKIIGERWYDPKEDRYFILITKAKRNETKMNNWLKGHARKMGRTEFNQRYGEGAYALAIDKKKPKGHHIHHICPLYAGIENGGVDEADNYALILGKDHKDSHFCDDPDARSIRDRLGPWTIYRAK